MRTTSGCNLFGDVCQTAHSPQQIISYSIFRLVPGHQHYRHTVTKERNPPLFPSHVRPCVLLVGKSNASGKSTFVLSLRRSTDTPKLLTEDVSKSGQQRGSYKHHVFRIAHVHYISARSSSCAGVSSLDDDRDLFDSTNKSRMAWFGQMNRTPIVLA